MLAGLSELSLSATQDDADQQAAAHELLARIAPQLLLLNAALKDSSEATTPSR